ncbi:MAG: hypothetical protein J0L62_13925 [Bacteroidetes bacterium]|nr:hypothetical protein [Bacteroidota bacterium]
MAPQTQITVTPGWTFPVSIISYTSEGNSFFYCPELNLIGYGASEQEAQKSFQISKREFFRFLKTNPSFFLELKKLGWTGSENSKKMCPPSWAFLLENDEIIREVVAINNFSKKQVKMRITT